MHIRPAKTVDALAIARVYLKTWQDTYRGIVPDLYLDAMTLGRAQRAYRHHLQSDQDIWYTAEEEQDHVVGFISGGAQRNRDPVYGGEIYELYVLKEYQRRGIGGQLAATLATRLDQKGIHSLMVWVLAQNPYRRFYEKINGVYLSSGSIHFAGAELKAAAYGWISSDLIYHL